MLASVFPEDWDTFYVLDAYGATDLGKRLFGPSTDFGSGTSGVDVVLVLAKQGRVVSWDRVETDPPTIRVAVGSEGIVKVSRQEAVMTVSILDDNVYRLTLA